MRRSLRKFRWVLLLFGAVIGSLWIALERHETHRLKEAYGREALKILALDAALAFPTTNSDVGGLRYWPRPETPCIFTTNVVKRSGNSRRVSWDNWPSGTIPTCTDFYSSKERPYDPQTTIPSNCLPVATFSNRGGANLSFVVLAADGANVQSLASANISPEARAKLMLLDRFLSYPDTGKFIRGGGLEGVSVELQEVNTCRGFTLFRYQTDVRDLPALRSRLEAEGYKVGLK